MNACSVFRTVGFFQWLAVPKAIRSIRAKSTPLNTKAIWITTFHKNISVLASVGSSEISIKVFRRWMVEIATMAPMTFNLSPLKSTFPIQSGRSEWSPTSILETKISWPEKMIMSNKDPIRVMSIRARTPMITSL